MTTAMMLPTTLPLVLMFQRLTAARADRVRLTTALIAGYLCAWTVFGVLVLFAAWALQAWVPAWLAGNSRYTTAGLFVLAGAFQFSRLKYQCLDKCRSPLSFLTSRWRGTGHGRQSFRLGVEHGAFCVGCCWALMLLLFAGGVMNVMVIVALTAFVGLEKLAPLGAHAARIGGVLLMAAGFWMVVR